MRIATVLGLLGLVAIAHAARTDLRAGTPTAGRGDIKAPPKPGTSGSRISIGPYLQDVRRDGVIVAWETDGRSTGEVVITLPTGERRFPSPAAQHHEVRVTGLPPGRYPYQVVTPAMTSAPADLVTAATGSQFTFLVYGDNRDGDTSHGQVIAGMVQEHADLAINTGDLTSDGDVESLWRRFFAIEAPLLSTLPLYPALGNHEVHHDPTARHYHRFFALPGPANLEDSERYYAFRYANAEFIALDSNQSHHREQAAWLLRTLQAASLDPAIRHVFVYFHHPPFSNGPECGSAVEQGRWVPHFEHYKVRAVFAGHEHAYQHLERAGVRYFVTGGGGAPLYAQSPRCPRYDREALRLYYKGHHYLRVRVLGDQVTLDATSADGAIFETVQLHEPTPPDPTPPAIVPYVQEPVDTSHAQLIPTETTPAPPDPHRSALRAWLWLLIPLGIFAAVVLVVRRRPKPPDPGAQR